MNTVIEIEELMKEFKGKRAVDQISLTIQRGEVVAILGPNGAGKSTTIHMLLGLLTPTSGSATLFQQCPKERKVRDRIGVMLQEVSLIDALTVKELLASYRGYYSQPLPLKQLIDLTGLTSEDLSKRTEKLSGGQKRRVGFALALAGNPDVLFFDEPTVGMDSTSRKRFWATVHELAKQGKTILFSTHYLQEADDVATRIVLFNKGKIVADHSPEKMKKEFLKQVVSFSNLENFPYEQFRSLPSVLQITNDDQKITIQTNDSDEVLRMLYSESFSLRNVSIEKGRLEDAFEQLIVGKGE